MSLPLEELMNELAAYLKTDLSYERGVYSLVVPLESGRHQEVCAAIRSGQAGREVIDFVSTVGEVHGRIDPWALLQENGAAIFCRVTVSHRMLFVLASQLLATAQPEEVLLMLREVATFSDRLEQQFFGADSF
ncbi:MAG TPA: hypothetical protein VLA19_33240 [Herpetosiphonaceae bacterium]|nr:hypothetical protein [Herpetosiphonaceae bacterium]